jgi:hypothetical protein
MTDMEPDSGLWVAILITVAALAPMPDPSNSMQIVVRAGATNENFFCISTPMDFGFLRGASIDQLARSWVKEKGD